MLQQTSMETNDRSNVLAKIGVAIDTSLREWEEYLATIADQASYETIISESIQDTTTKTKALRHLLEVLPCRHAALVIAYGDANIKFIELDRPCANLFAELQKAKSDVDLGTWFNRVLLGKKLVKTISQYEADVHSAEQGRLQELNRLKAQHLALTMVSKDGELGANEVGKLLDAMEEIGVPLEIPGAFADFRDEADECLPAAGGQCGS
jgi:hypothetical protein